MQYPLSITCENLKSQRIKLLPTIICPQMKALSTCIKPGLLFSFLLILVPQLGKSRLQTGSYKTEPNIVQEVLNSHKDSVDRLQYGITVLLKYKSKVFQGSIGIASPGEKFTNNHLFNIGSLTKTFTAVLIFQEVEKGTLKLSDSLGKFFPVNKNVDPSITIEDLLKHQSGLGELAVDTVFNRVFADAEHPYNFSNLYWEIPSPVTKKKQHSQYCNTNYILLGYILEKVTDQSYHDLLRKRIFIPCKMANSYPYASKNIPMLSHPMFKGNDLFRYLHYRFYSNYSFAAGSVVSNCADLLLFFEGLYEQKKLVSDSSLTAMTTFDETFGMGLFQIIFREKEFWGHGGDNLSYSVRNYYDPKDGTLLIIAGNEINFRFRKEITEDIMEKIGK